MVLCYSNETQIQTTQKHRHTPTINSTCVHQFISHLSSIDLGLTWRLHASHIAGKILKSLYFWLPKNPGCYSRQASPPCGNSSLGGSRTNRHHTTNLQSGAAQPT
jgi:hypothetical protein